MTVEARGRRRRRDGGGAAAAAGVGWRRTCERGARKKPAAANGDGLLAEGS